MTSLFKMAALGAIVTLSIGVMATPVIAQGRLCLRFDNKSLMSNSHEGQDAYDRAAALGNRCFTNRTPGVTILPAPKADELNNNDYYFLSRRQRQQLRLTD